MKTMNILYKSVAAVALLSTMIACEPNMDYVRPDAPTEEGYYTTKEHLIYAANGCYNIPQILQFWGRNMPYMTNLISDEAVSTPNAIGDPEDQLWSGYNYQGAGMTAEIWQNIYVMQYTANLALQKLSTDLAKSVFAGDEATLNRSLGEAYFFRAFSAYLSVFYYGDAVPYRDYPATGGASDSYEPARAPGEIYGYMVEDLKKAAELLPGRTELYKDPNNQGRIGKGAAQALLAKLYLGRPIFDSSTNATADYELAKAELKKIIDSGDYKLVDCYRDNGSDKNENNEESLYEVQFIYSADASVNLSIDALNFGQNSWRRVGFTVPSEVSGYWYNAMPSTILYQEFERDANGKVIDARAFQGLWIPDGAVYYKGNVAFDYNTMSKYKGVDENIGKYFGTRKMGTDGDDNQPDYMRGPCNDRILRYADVLLMYAECCLETGDEGTAKRYIDMVRARANNQVLTESKADEGLFYTTGKGSLPTVDEVLAAKPVVGRVLAADGSVILPGITLDTTKKILRHEFTCELFLEGWRMYNVRRWYLAGDKDVIKPLEEKYRVQQLQTGENFARKFDYAKNSILPIPDAELNNNPNMKANSANNQ